EREERTVTPDTNALALPETPAAPPPSPAGLPLPDYRRQDPAVQDRFRRIRQRPTVLDVVGLGKTFPSAAGPVEVLRDLSFQVHRREFLCVIGQSGCGKSTLIRILAGLEEQTVGIVEVDGKPVSGPGPDRGMVFQNYTLFPWLTVKRNVMFGLREKGVPRRQAEEEARQWVDVVGLTKFLDAYPYQLSGGMKQRVAIARALANQPRVLLMDEPFGALDAQTRAQMQAYLKQIWMNVDVTIVFITHDLDEAVYMADRILVLRSNPGRIAEVIEVPLLQPRAPESLFDARFIATRLRLEEWIHPKAENGAEKHPVKRMAPPGDEVL
ncbi:MAG TPA: ABC transporter ATP-binding protein, partial [Gemmataceae bacterium]|nr:ABC transporter ATP-binding protein [Gemmataceae bacterium]